MNHIKYTTRLLLTFLLIISLSTGCTMNQAPQSFDCTSLRENFDTYTGRSNLPIINDSDSLCYGLNMNANFSELDSKWAVGELIQITDSAFTFKGIEKNATILTTLTNEEAKKFMIGRDYMIDMNNMCRYFFMMADSRYPSPIEQTLVNPKEINCT